MIENIKEWIGAAKGSAEYDPRCDHCFDILMALGKLLTTIYAPTQLMKLNYTWTRTAYIYCLLEFR